MTFVNDPHETLMSDPKPLLEGVTCHDELIAILNSVDGDTIEPSRIYYKKLFEPSIPPEPILEAYTIDDNNCPIDYVVRLKKQTGFGKSLGDTIVIPQSEAIRVAHYITYLDVTQGVEEESFEHIFDVKLPGRQGKMTPDFHYKNDQVHVVEFATSSSTHVQGLLNSYNTKLTKYYDTLKAHAISSNMKAKLHVIVVGTSGVLSSLNISDSLAAELVFRYRFSKKVVGKLEEVGITQSFKDQDESLAYKEVDKMITNLKFDFDSEGEWTRANYELWVSPITEYEVENVSKNILSCYKDSANLADKEAKQRIMSKEKKETYCDELLDSFITDCVLKNNNRLDLKPCTIFPLLVPKSRPFYKSYDFSSVLLNISNVDAISNTWKAAIASAKRSEEYMFEENLTNSAKAYMNNISHDQKNRSSYKRVHLNLTDDEWEDLSTKGIRGKEFSSCKKYKEAMSKSKLGFHPNVSTDDIDLFMSSKDLFTTEDNCGGYIEMLFDLLSRANVMAENSICDFSKTIVNTLKTFSKTAFFRYACFITEIACELLMTLRQNCKKEYFVLKTLKYSNILLLIKPTNSTEHIFFSLMCETDDETLMGGLPFTTMHKSEGIVYTDFVSANAQQLSHWAITGPMSIVMLEVWMKFCDLPFNHFEEQGTFKNADPEFCKMMNLSLLVFLEQKTSTEEVFTLFRYGSMECFKDKPGFCNPLKILDKMPTMFRSRLTSWTFKKLSLEFRKLTGKGYRHKRSDAVDVKKTKVKTSWSNLVNPYTGTIITDPSKIVNLYYLGYLRNKHTKSNSNQDIALISKILKGEKEYINADDKDSIGSCYFNPEYKHNPHNYDVGFCKILSTYIKKGYYNRTGENLINNIKYRFIDALVHQNPDVFMTLKASSSFKPGDEDLLLDQVKKQVGQNKRSGSILDPESVSDHVDRLADDNEYQDGDKEFIPFKSRPRVIEEFSDIVKDYDPVCLYLSKSLEICKKHGLMIDIFKKPQQGGLREIYVLTRESRLIQLTIETLSRLLCNTFESETMTHPKNKIRLMTDHGVLTRKKTTAMVEAVGKSTKRLGDFCIVNSNSSKDKKSWNNTNSPSKFAILLLRITPEDLHPLIFNSLKLWDKKQMLLPTGIQNILRKGLKWDVQDPIMNEFFKSYDQADGVFSSCIHKDKPYITIKTGMMQGILHFTSSLMHTSFNLFIKSLFINNSKKFAWIQNCIFTHLESSDDSAYLRTMWIHVKKKREALRYLYINELFTTKICKLAGFHESMQKSSHHSSRVVEFNSEFCFDDQVYKPDMKFAFVCLRIPENESLSESCYQYKCLSSACLESGTTILGVHLIQLAQAFTHYLTLGLTLNPLFRAFSKHIMATTDPGLGFFPLDPCMLSGVVDHQFNVWMLLKGNPVFCIKTSTLLSTEKISSYSGGTLLKSAVLLFGDRRRWRGIVSRMEKRIGNNNYREVIKKRPQLLFLKPTTAEERVAYQFLKMYTPSIISSLGNVGRLDRMLIRGGYAIQHKCLTIGSLWTDLLDTSNKQSLATLVRQMCNMVLKFLETEEDLVLDNDEKDMIETFRRFTRLDNEEDHYLLSEFSFEEIKRIHRNMINSSIISLNDQRKIFPQVNEYITLLSNHRALCNSHWTFWESKEKKRATVPVFEAPIQDLLSLENLCVQKWFDVKRHKLTDSVTNAQWEIFKTKYSWIRDSFDESFKASNFDNEVSFANFIKMQMGKTRRLFVCSAPLKLEDGHSELYSLITRHFWPGVILKAQNQNKILNKSSKELIHPIAALSSLKMDSYKKVEVLKQISESHENYKSLMEEFVENPASSSREMKLQPMIRLLRGDPREEMEVCILKSKLGVIGSWVKQETYNPNTNSYMGTGKWQGRMDDLIIIINTNNAKVVSMEVNNGASFRLLFGVLRNWMREVKLEFADNQLIKSDEMERIVAAVRGGILHDMISDSKCTPVYKTMEVISPNLESYSDYHLSITQHSIQLRAHMKRFVKDKELSDDVTVLAMRLYDSDYLSDPMEYIIRDDMLLSHLLSNKPLGVRAESQLDAHLISVGVSGHEKIKAVVRVPKTVPFWEAVNTDGMSVGEFVKSFNDSKAELVSLDKDDMLSRLLTTYNFSLQDSDTGERLSSNIVAKLLPSRFDYPTTDEGIAFLKNLLPQLIREARFKVGCTFPESLKKKGFSQWNHVILRTADLEIEDIITCITALTNKTTILIERRERNWELTIYYAGKIETHLTRSLDSVNLILSYKEKTARLFKTNLLKQVGPKVINFNKRLVAASSSIDASKVDWKNIKDDLTELKALVTDRRNNRYDKNGLKKQLGNWLCKSFYDDGLMSQTFIHTLTGVNYEVDDFQIEQSAVPESMSAPDPSESSEEFDFEDEFDAFLESADCDDYEAMFTGETATHSYDSDSSVDNLVLDETLTNELHKYVSEYERKVKVSIPKVSLFDMLVVKLRIDFGGFFLNANSNIVRSAVPDSLFNMVNFFLSGKLIREHYDPRGW